ncbi:MAG TPA: class I SAM-dependent methyltransferase [Patescibacteria group bacterium]
MKDKAFWRFYSLVYDTLLRLIPYQKLLQRVIRAIGPPDQTLKILDAGCGTGNLEMFINQQAINAAIIGVDSTPAMLAIARKKNRASRKNCRFQPADLNQTLPFEDSAFDVVVAINVLYALAQPLESLKEFWRILRPEGRLIIVTPKNKANLWPILGEHIRLVQADLKSFWGRLVAWLKMGWLVANLLIVGLLNLIILKRGRDKKYHFYELPELEELVTTAGFELEETDSDYGHQDWFLVSRKANGRVDKTA